MTTKMRIMAIRMMEKEQTTKIEVKDRHGKLLARAEMKKKEEK